MKRLITIGYICFCFLGSCDKVSDDLNKLDLNSLNGTWCLDKFIDKQDGDIFYLPNDYSASISFQGDDCILVIGPCNSGQGNFNNSGNKITVSNLSLTKRGCQILEYEETFIHNLSGVYLINGDLLKVISDYDTDLFFYKSDTSIIYRCNEEKLISDLIIDSLVSQNALYTHH